MYLYIKALHIVFIALVVCRLVLSATDLRQPRDGNAASEY